MTPGNSREPDFSKRVSIAYNPDASKLKLHKLGTAKKEDEELAGGVCMAMCLLWFKRIFQSQYKDVTWTGKADSDAAKMIFLQYVRTQHLPGSGSGMQKEMEIYEGHGMTLHAVSGESSDNEYYGNIRGPGGEEAREWIKKTPELTCFLISITKHEMAGFWKRGSAFFFDPNCGVYEESNINDFADVLVDYIYERYLKGTDDPTVLFNKVTRGTS